MHHDNGKIGMGKNVPCDTADQTLAQAAFAISADDQKIGAAS